MNLRFFEPLPPLRGYIDKMWVLESACGLPQHDMKMLVPDGRMLLLVPFKNAMVGRMGEREYFSKENRMSLVGIGDLPSMVDTEHAGELGVMGIDFTPEGAYRFFQWRLKETKNEVNALSDILGKQVKILEEKMMIVEAVDRKMQMVQEFLFNLFTQRGSDRVFEYCIKKIKSSKGAITIKQLEQETGYSSRWLNMKFDERLGISPKNFSSIARFNFYYQALLTNASRILTDKEFYNHYYDESHFIREFRRFTGMPPAKMESVVNNFGKLFI